MPSDVHNPLSSTEPSPTRLASRSVRYGAALLSVGVATLLRFSLNRFLGSSAVPFITFFPAVVFSAWIGGLGPGLLALALGAVLADYLFLLPAYSFALPDPTDLWSLGMFLVSGLCIAAIGEAQHRARQRAEQN